MRQGATPFLAALVLATALLLAAAVPEVAAWSYTGHSLTGRIANQLVRPSTRRALQQLLPEVDGDLARVSNWADEAKRTMWRFSDTAPLHYSDPHDNPPDSCSYILERDCPDGYCVTVAIQEFSWAVRNATLAKQPMLPPTSLEKRSVNVDNGFVDMDNEIVPLHMMVWVDAQRRHRRPNRPPRRQLMKPNQFKAKLITPGAPLLDELPDKSLPLGQRYTVVETLKLLVHLVQDIHQPLHLADRDRGGNSKIVAFGEHMSSLHIVWDKMMIEKHMREEHGGSEIALAEDLIEQLATEWRADISSWVHCPLAMPGAGKGVPRAFAAQADSTRVDSAHVAGSKAPDAPDHPGAMGVVLCPEYWAKQSDQLNCATVWQNLEGDLSGEYYDTNLPVARRAIAMAAVRLAALLDVVLAGMAA
ncbi:hypothetical protein GGF32_004376 [Allomyces javanicus]|nr:hypothetical protein GGF32_004376 [Allomyces javanicus]